MPPVRLQRVDGREHSPESVGRRRPSGIGRALDSGGQGLALSRLVPAHRAARQVRGHHRKVPARERTVHVPGQEFHNLAMTIGFAHPDFSSGAGFSSAAGRLARPRAVRSGASRRRAWNIRVFTVFTGARVISAISAYEQP